MGDRGPAHPEAVPVGTDQSEDALGLERQTTVPEEGVVDLGEVGLQGIGCHRPASDAPSELPRWRWHGQSSIHERRSAGPDNGIHTGAEGPWASRSSSTAAPSGTLAANVVTSGCSLVMARRSSVR